MKYINVFADASAYEQAGELAKPQLSLIKDGMKIYSLTEVEIPEEPAANEIWYTTTDGNICDVSAAMDEMIEMIGFSELPDSSVNRIISNTYNSEKQHWVLKCEKDITALGVDITGTNDYNINLNYLYPMFLSFTGDSNLQTVTLSDTVTTLYSGAFSDCTNIETIDISNVTNIYNRLITDWAVFGRCTNLSNIILSNNINYIESDTFINCTSLPDENGYVYISKLLVNVKNKTLSTYTIKNDTTVIGAYSFRDCTNMTSLTIPNNVINIGDRAFENCTSLTNINIPNSVTTIEYGAFRDCDSLTNINIPNSVTSIESYAFYSCNSLTNIIIPNSVTILNINTFSNCTHMTSCIIGNSVSSIGEEAFKDCTSLMTVTSLNTVPPTLGDNVFYNVPSNCAIYVPSESVDTYKAASGWSGRANYIQAIQS